MQKLVKVGIDLSTTNIGLCIMCGDLHPTAKYELKPFGEKNLEYNMKKLAFICFRIQWYINTLKVCPKIMVGIELSNFRNPMLTGRFNFYAGIIVAYLYYHLENIERIKMFNSNQWQNLVGCKAKDQRETRKLIAKEFAQKVGNLSNDLSEDEYDAWCIAYFLEKLETTEDIKKRSKNAAKNKNSTLSHIVGIHKMIDLRNAKLNDLGKYPLGSKKRYKINYEIEDLKIKIRKLKEGKNE